MRRACLRVRVFQMIIISVFALKHEQSSAQLAGSGHHHTAAVLPLANYSARWQGYGGSCLATVTVELHAQGGGGSEGGSSSGSSVGAGEGR